MIKLQKSTFLYENKTKKELCDFITSAKILSMGEECHKFERAFAVAQQTQYAVFVNSGSSANLVLIQALMNLGRLQAGDIVGVSALTWATNIMPLIQLGLVPQLIDCEVETLNVSGRTLMEAITAAPEMKAVFITNTLGLCDDLSKVSGICHDHGIFLIEDNCESMGSRFADVNLGNWGVASTFSFFVGHHLSTIEGGMVCTSDPELHEQVTMVRAHGWDRSLSPATQARMRNAFSVNDFYAKYTFYDLAYNVRPSEINGFIGNSQIKYWDMIVNKRQENFLYLNSVIKKNPDLIAIDSSHMDLVSSFAIPIIVKENRKLKQYMAAFEAAEVEIRPMIAGNMAEQPFYRKYIKNPGFQKNSNFIHNNSFYCGNNPELTDDELELLANLLKV